jgi:hypothetical protein
VSRETILPTLLRNIRPIIIILLIILLHKSWSTVSPFFLKKSSLPLPDRLLISLECPWHCRSETENRGQGSVTDSHDTGTRTTSNVAQQHSSYPTNTYCPTNTLSLVRELYRLIASATPALAPSYFEESVDCRKWTYKRKQNESPS